jgi:hypothetical protein
MASSTTNYPPGVRPDRWGPAILEGAKFYIYQGEEKLVPIEWRDNPQRFLKALNTLEKTSWSYVLPHEREELFRRKFEILTKGLHHDWVMIVGTAFCGIVIIIGVASIIRSKL